MARARLDDAVLDSVTIRRNLKFQADAATLGGHVTVLDNSGIVNAYDCGGSSRNVTLPTRAAANDGVVRVYINLSTAGETLTIKEASTTLVVVNPGSMAIAIATGTVEAPGTRAWAAYLVGGEDLAIADDLSVTGDLTVAGNASLGDATTDMVGFFGVANMCVQMSGTAQAAVTVCTPVSGCGIFGFSTSSQATNLVALANEIRRSLVAYGLMKGS